MFDLQAYTATLEQTNGGLMSSSTRSMRTSRPPSSPTRLAHDAGLREDDAARPEGGMDALPQHVWVLPRQRHRLRRRFGEGVLPHSASSSEFAVYEMHATSLRLLGAAVAPPPAAPSRRRRRRRPRRRPRLCPCLTLLRAKLPTPADISVTARRPHRSRRRRRDSFARARRRAGDRGGTAPRSSSTPSPSRMTAGSFASSATTSRRARRRRRRSEGTGWCATTPSI